MTPGQDDRVLVRSLRADEEDLLAAATLGNVNWSGDRFTFDQVMQTPFFAHYFNPWPGDGDFGLVAENADGSPAGVAWLRFFTATDPGYGFVDAAFPELSIWVAASQRGVGIGTLLLTSLLEDAHARDLPGVSLSVEQGNPARALYERVGFAAIGPEFDPGTLVTRFAPKVT